MYDAIPEDGRLTRARFDALTMDMAKSKTRSEVTRRQALKVAMAARNGDVVRMPPI